jgi:hypothetical protein
VLTAKKILHGGVRLAVLWLLLNAATARAATNSAWLYRAWQPDEGLPDNTVTGISQTTDGFLWVATPGGLTHFDGVRFQDFAPANTAGTPSSVMQALMLDHLGRLWIAKELGTLLCLDNGHLSTLSAAQGLPKSRVTVLVEDGGGAVWVAHADGQLARIQQGRVHTFTAADGWGDNLHSWLACDMRGRLWFVRNGELGVYEKGRFRVLHELHPDAYCIAAARSGGIWVSGRRELWRCRETNSPVLLGPLPAFWPNAITTALCEDHTGAVWMGTEEAGLFRYDDSGFVSVKTSHREILSIAEDREGSLWVGTRLGGLNRLRRSALELQDILPDLPPEAVTSVCQDTAGDLWATTQSGLVSMGQENNWNVLSTDPDWFARYANCISPAADGGVWIGTQHRGLVSWREGQTTDLRQADGLAGDSIRSLLTTRSGDVWIGTEGSNGLHRLREGHLTRFPLPNETSVVSTLAEDATSGLWAGTSDGHLLRILGDVMTDLTDKTLPEPQAIRCLTTTPEGSLWIGYAGRGVGRWKAGRFTQFRARQGLRDDYISQILPDSRGRLWFGGNRGLFFVKQNDFDLVASGKATRVRSVSYDWEEGVLPLQSSHDHWPGAFQSSDGRLWFPTRRGLAVLDPEQVAENPIAPPVVIERVSIDGSTAALYHPMESPGETNAPACISLRQSGPRLNLPPGNQQTVIEFTALSLTAPGNMSFRYRLEGLDKGWMDFRGRRSASYPHLDPGNYRFTVIASNNDGLWNEIGASLKIHVMPFFWQSWWFRALSVILVLGANGAAARYYALRRIRRRLEQIDRERAVENERSRIARDIHDDLGANLTEITLLSELAQSPDAPPQEVQADIRKIAVRARELTRSVDATVWAVNPRFDNFDSFVSYACSYAEDYLVSAGVRLRMDVPGELPNHALPPEVRHNVFLILKEALNNTVKHAAATEVWLRLALLPGGFTLTLEDNGKGFQSGPEPMSASAHHDGLLNMRKRIQSIGGELQIHTETNRGTTIHLRVHFRPG